MIPATASSGSARADRAGRPPAPLADALEIGRGRLVFAAVMVFLAFAVVGGRLVDATVMRPGGMVEATRAVAATGRPPGRADIVDRNGVLLATSLATASAYADPALVIDPRHTARRLVAVLPELDFADLVEKLTQAPPPAPLRRFVWLKRNLTPRQHEAVHRLGLPGIAFRTEERRFYPAGRLGAHVVGYTGIDQDGLSGLERAFDRDLKHRPGPLALSLDLRLQHVLRRALATQIETFSAIGGAGLIFDVNTAEVLAMVSLPDFDPHDPPADGDVALFNRNSLGVYEMGSTFKLFNTAMALESGQVRVTDAFDARHPIRVGRFTINDFHGKHRWLTVREIFVHSSNIGSVKIALQLGTSAQRAFLGDLGFLRPVPIELPEAGWPLVPAPWREINTMTIAFGHGLSVSPLHLVTATAAMVNGGLLRAPTVLKREEGAEVPGRRVIAEATSAELRRLLRLVVREGTASKADAPGYLVGGKTGTAEKQKGRHYSRSSLLSSFVGVFPMNAPRLIVFVMLDEPKGTEESHGYATAGWVAAPAVARLVSEIGPMLAIAPVFDQRPDLPQSVVATGDDDGGGATLASYRPDGR